MKKQQMLVLVNLISPDYLTRFQAPLAINALAGYVGKKVLGVCIEKIDMQVLFNEGLSRNLNRNENFALVVRSTVNCIVELSIEHGLIVGLSLKWTTQKVAKSIVEQVEKMVGNDKILFVLGNIGSTYGYQDLLQQSVFAKTIAVVGEGEDALVEIVRIVNEHANDFTDVNLYHDIANVAVRQNGKVSLHKLARVDLASYPEQPIAITEQIFDEEYGFHAIETSRGCPWGNCTFCAIKGQFGPCHSGYKPDWRWRGFPVNVVLEGIRHFAQQGARVFDIKDSEFFGPIKVQKEGDPFQETISRVEDFAQGLIRVNGEIKRKSPEGDNIAISHISARVDTIYVEGEIEKNARRKQIYILLKEAGLRSVFLGIESGSPTQLKRYCKGITVHESKMALRILEEIGLEVEPGFIMFDPLATVEELRENIRFIKDTKLYRYDSRILGSLRVQAGSPYVVICERHNLLGEKDDLSLTYSSCFQSAQVASIESILREGEEATRNLVKLFSPQLRRQSYLSDFLFLKALLGTKNPEQAISDYIRRGRKLIENNGKNFFGSKSLSLTHEYLEYALHIYEEMSNKYR